MHIHWKSFAIGAVAATIVLSMTLIIPHQPETVAECLVRKMQGQPQIMFRFVYEACENKAP